MNLQQYPKVLETFRQYYTNKILDVQKQLGGTETLPKFTDKQLEDIIKGMSSAVFYFLDENDIFVSIIYNDEDNTFTYKLTDNKVLFVITKFNKRLDCEYVATEEGFKILNDKL